MNDIIEDFLTFFRLDSLADTSSLSVGDFLGLSFISFFALVFTIIGIRIVFELIKIVTDWSRFK